MLTLSAEEIGIRISRLRRRKKITQIELAEKMYISFQAVSNWERGQTMPDLTRIYELAQIFDVSVDELLNGQSEITTIQAEETKSVVKEENKNIVNMKGNNTMKFNEIKNAAEFMSQELIDEILQKYMKEHLGEDDGFFWHMIEYVSDECREQIKNSEYMKKLAEKVLNEKGTGALWQIGEYLSKDAVDNYIKNNCM